MTAAHSKFEVPEVSVGVLDANLRLRSTSWRAQFGTSPCCAENTCCLSGAFCRRRFSKAIFSEGVGFADLLLPYFGHLGIHTLVDSTILIDSGGCRIWLVLPRFQLPDAIAVLCKCLQLFKRGEEDRFHAESLGF